MKTNQSILSVAIAVGLALFAATDANAAVVVSKIYDGDTITLSTGERVRLLQIDTPELSPAECYGEEARTALGSLLRSSGDVYLKTDPKLDKVDRYGRLLRYVYVGKTNINLKLVEIGAATPYFYKGDKGMYSNQMLRAAQKAKAKSLGLWKKCPGTQLTPTNAISTVAGVKAKSETSTPVDAKCDPNYTGCIPIFPSDVDCPDIKRLGLAPVRVIGVDIHRLDRDGDGIGCDK
jgi:endonuclease YncB( thermonuclease family)